MNIIIRIFALIKLKKMDTPTRYKNIPDEILSFQKEHSLTDVQTLLYNHIVRGDFKLRNEDGQLFYCKENNGFGWSGDRQWVKRQFKKLIDKGLVKFESVKDCRDPRYTSWYFYSPNHDINELVDAGCYVRTWKLAFMKHHLNLPDGFDKKNKTYGDVEFIYNKKKGYTFKYKGEENIYAWDHNSKGIKEDLTWLTGQPTWKSPIYYADFSEMVHDVCSFLVHDGVDMNRDIPGTTNGRQFKI